MIEVSRFGSSSIAVRDDLAPRVMLCIRCRGFRTIAISRWCGIEWRWQEETCPLCHGRGLFYATWEIVMVDASYKADLTPKNETFPPPCVNHPGRLGNMWRQGDGARVCADCWREDNIQAPITTDAECVAITSAWCASGLSGAARHCTVRRAIYTELMTITDSYQALERMRKVRKL